MRLAILAAADSWYARDLLRAAGERHQLAVLPFSEVELRLGPQGEDVRSGGVSLREFDAVLVRTMPPGSLEQVVFRMDALLRLEAAGTPVFNPPRALETAVDKCLASAKLQAAGFATPRTAVCQTIDQAMAAFDELGGRVVLKPLFGGEGRGITRLDDRDLAVRAFSMLVQLGAVLYLQEFIPHFGHDLRLFVLGRRVYGLRRANPNDWRTNVSRGAKAVPCEVLDEQRELALRAAATIGAPLAGVDLLPGCDGVSYLLEVNAVPGWKALARAHRIDIAAEVLEFIAQSVSDRASHEPLTGRPR